MSGGMDIGYLFANKAFGVSVGGIMALAICVLLISTTNSMIIVGPRVSLVMGEDYKRLRFLSILNNREVPYVAILIQSIIAIIYLLTSTFESLLIFIGFVLSLISFLTVLGLFLIKTKDQVLIAKFKSFGYPIVPALFLLINFTMLVYGLIYKPQESIFGLLICIIGYLVYMFISPKKDD
jgi:APA family basic amino acid/polyamine antiporter